MRPTAGSRFASAGLRVLRSHPRVSAFRVCVHGCACFTFASTGCASAFATTGVRTCIRESLRAPCLHPWVCTRSVLASAGVCVFCPCIHEYARPVIAIHVCARYSSSIHGCAFAVASTECASAIAAADVRPHRLHPQVSLLSCTRGSVRSVFAVAGRTCIRGCALRPSSHHLESLGCLIAGRRKKKKSAGREWRHQIREGEP